MSKFALSTKFWGVRGSIPSSLGPYDWSMHIEGMLREFFNSGYKDPSQISKFFASHELPHIAGYGTATSCVEVTTPKTQIIIDGGSGIRGFSEKVMSGTYGRAKGPYHIFLTHFHWDHVLGLPFFAPHFLNGVNIHYYAVQPELEQNIRQVFSKPFFPVPFDSLSAKVHFHVLEPRKTITINDMNITPFRLDHPDPCWGYKVESGGKVYAHCVDTEGTRVTRDELGEDLPLYQNVDLMYFDAQYSFNDLAEKGNWGHSASQVGIEIAFREKIAKVLFAHHDPGATIQQLKEMKQQTKEYYDWRLKSGVDNEESPLAIHWDFAYEGLEIKI